MGHESGTVFPVGKEPFVVGDELFVGMTGDPEAEVKGGIAVTDEPLVETAGNPEAEVNGGIVGRVGRVVFTDKVGKPEL